MCEYEEKLSIGMIYAMVGKVVTEQDVVLHPEVNPIQPLLQYEVDIINTKPLTYFGARRFIEYVCAILKSGLCFIGKPFSVTLCTCLNQLT